MSFQGDHHTNKHNPDLEIFQDHFSFSIGVIVYMFIKVAYKRPVLVITIDISIDYQFLRIVQQLRYKQEQLII